METKKTPVQIKAQIENRKEVKGNPPLMLLKGDQDYDKKRNPFNLRFNVYPAVIVFCTTTEQAQAVVKVAIENKEHYKLRVRSGAHDHEGECTDTDAIVIDFSKMHTFDLDENKVIRIDSGTIFKQVIPTLDKNNVSIPHGTCETVGVMGFTLGGGWGPWTRHKGMCCEHVVGATMIDAEGEIKNLSIKNKEDKELLWALRGGGGFTFGILTELFIQTFDQPKHTLRFTLTWEKLLGGKNIPPALQILERWENAIEAGTNKNLIGTNLQIFAIPEDNHTIESSMHPMNFYGYYGSSSGDILDELATDIEKWFPGNLKPTAVTIITSNEKNNAGVHAYNFDSFEDKFKHKHVQISQDKYSNFGSWERESHDLLVMKSQKELIPEEMKHFPPDLDEKAPHKLSSKLVQEGGFNDEGRKGLLRTLRSKNIFGQHFVSSVHTYVTLGAICGNYYGPNFVRPSFPEGISFPFQKRPYTIQYQVWWNETKKDKLNYDKEKVDQALEWIAGARDTKLDQTSGSFISFKDAKIAIKEYFLDNLDNLHTIKKREDPNNFFGTATTIKA